MWLPLSCIRLPTVHGSPIWHQLPLKWCHMAPVQCTWLPYGACCPHVVPTTSHTRTWLPYGSQMARAAPIQQMLAPTWPLHGARGSQMAPSALHMARMTPIWCRQIHTVHMALKTHHLSSIWHYMASTWHAWLPYGAHGSCTVHTAPLRCTWLPSASCIVQHGLHLPLAPIAT
jgi:hypothetical protein